MVNGSFFIFYWLKGYVFMFDINEADVFFFREGRGVFRVIGG